MKRFSARRIAPRLDLVLVGCAGLLLLVFLVQTYRKAYRPGGYDLTCYLSAARMLASGRSPYEATDPLPYIYPMFLAFVLIPFLALPDWLVHFAWFMIGVLSLLWAVGIMLRAQRGPPLVGGWSVMWLVRHRSLHGSLAGLFLLFAGIIQPNFLNGQINFILLLLCLLFWSSFRNERRILAATYLAAAIATKLTPLVFLPYLVFRRAFGTLGLAMVLSVVFCATLPACLLSENTGTIYRQYVDRLIMSELTASTHSDLHPTFFTLHGFMAYCVPALKDSVVAKIASAMLVFLTLAAVQFIHDRRRGAGDGWILNCHLVATLLLSPMSETHHLVFLLPAVCLAVAGDRQVVATERIRRNAVFLGSLMAALLLGKLVGGPGHFLAVVLVFVRCADAAIASTPGNEKTSISGDASLATAA